MKTSIRDCLYILIRLRWAARFVRYIADSPPHEHGGFSPQAKQRAQELLNRQGENT